MRLVHVVNLRLHAQLLEEAGTALPQHDVLRDTRHRVGVIQTLRDGAAHLIVLRQVRGEEEHRRGAEGLRAQEVSLHPHGGVADADEELDVVVLQEAVVFAAVLHGHGTVIGADLVVVAIGPQDAHAH